MEIDLVEIVVGILTGSEAFTNVMGDRLFPLIADEGTELPYAVYRIEEDEEVSKDAGQRYYVTVALVFGPKNYLTALQLKRDLVPLFTGAADCNFTKLPSPVEFFHEPEQCIVASLNFEAIDY